MSVPSEFSIVGTVLALAVAILLLSGLALYVAFRLRETLRDEKGGGTRTVKVAFLIGMLFLSGGVFYFFASGFNGPGGSSTTQGSFSTTSTMSSSLVRSSTETTFTSATSPTGTTTASSTSTTTTTSTAQGVTMPTPSCPSRVTAGSTFVCYVTVYNQGSTSYGSATLVSSGDFLKFAILGCAESVNGGPSTSLSTTSNSVAIGNLSPGTTVLTISIQAPAQSGQYSNDVLTLNAPGFAQPISATFSIQVTA